MARELGEGFVLGQTPWLRRHHFPLKGDKEETLLAKGHFFFLPTFPFTTSFLSFPLNLHLFLLLLSFLPFLPLGIY